MIQRAAVVSAVVALGAWSLTAQAQSQPNFSGTWVKTADGAAAAPGGRGRGMGAMGGFGEQVLVTQDAMTLKAETTQPDGTKNTFTYNLDGSESRNSVAGRQGGPPLAMVSKATWDGGKLSIATTINVEFNGNAFSFNMTDVLSMTGDAMTVQSTRSGFQGGAPTTTSSTYKKQ